MRCSELNAWTERINIELSRLMHAAQALENANLDMHLAAARGAILSAQAVLSINP